MALTYVKPSGLDNTANYTVNGMTVSSSLTVNGSTTLHSVSVTGNILPTSNNTFSLGNANYVFKDLFIGPGSLYVDGQKVLQSTANTMIFASDVDQNLRITSQGTGDIEFLTSGSGSVSIKGPMLIQANKTITSSDGNAVQFASPIGTDSITSKSANTDITLTANGTGHVKIDDDLVITGNITVQGTSGNLSVTSLIIQDNILDINAETTGTPTGNAGIRVIRGDEAATQLRYSETTHTWQITNDGATYIDIVGTFGNGTTNLGNSASANYFIGNGALLTGIAAGYSNTNVAAYLPTYSGNVSASYFIGNGYTLTSVNGSNVSGQVGNSLVSGTVYTASQPNITSVGTLTGLTVSGDATVSGNFTVGGTTSYINVTTLSVKDPIIELGGGTNGAPLTTNDGKDRGTLLHYYTTDTVDAFMGWDNSNSEFGFGSNVSVSSEVVTFNSYGNLRAGYFIGDGSALSSIAGGNVTGQVGNSLVAGTVYTNAQPNITSVGTLTSLTVTNKVTAGQLQGDGGNISNIQGANVTGTVSSATTAGTVTTASQPNITSVGTLTSLTVTGNVSASYFIGDGSQLTGLPASYSNSNVAAYLLTNTGNISAGYFIGNGSTLSSIAGANVTGQVSNSLVSGTVYTASQPNITSLGTLTSLTVNGITNLSAVGNVKITGGSNGQVLTTDGAGNLSWTSSSGSSIPVPPDIKVDSFTANGNTSSFTLTNTPTSKDYITVHINGVYQITDSYSLSGNVVTFNSTPYANTIVEVQVLSMGSGPLTAQTVTTNAQPNITSVGTLNGLTATGTVDFTSASNVSLGSNANIKITGGSANYVLQTDGTGNLSWAAQSGGGGASNARVMGYNLVFGL